ncbi:MAG: hypothetical protein JWL90_3170 [Chthoniobacteraceae bacterium]|nr:hypothetical protein [Chthoniobacteraceae bacterium]
MLILLVFFILANTAGAEFSAGGRRLLLSVQPFMVRLRYVGGGIVAGLGLAEYSFENAGWVAWLGIAALIVGSARHYAPTIPNSTATAHP